MSDNNYFQKDAKVTICSDAAGKHPRRIGVVKRIGNGAWRLGGCSEWYNFEGQRVTVDASKFGKYVETTCWARPYKEGDEAAIGAEDVRLNERAVLLRRKKEAERLMNEAQNYLTDLLQRADKDIQRAEETLKDAQQALDRAQSRLTAVQADSKRTIARAPEHEIRIKFHKSQMERLDAELAAFDAE